MRPSPSFFPSGPSHGRKPVRFRGPMRSSISQMAGAVRDGDDEKPCVPAVLDQVGRGGLRCGESTGKALGERLAVTGPAEALEEQREKAQARHVGASFPAPARRHGSRISAVLARAGVERTAKSATGEPIKGDPPRTRACSTSFQAARPSPLAAGSGVPNERARRRRPAASGPLGGGGPRQGRSSRRALNDRLGSGKGAIL